MEQNLWNKNRYYILMHFHRKVGHWIPTTNFYSTTCDICITQVKHETSALFVQQLYIHW